MILTEARIPVDGAYLSIHQRSPTTTISPTQKKGITASYSAKEVSYRLAPRDTRRSIHAPCFLLLPLSPVQETRPNRWLVIQAVPTILRNYS